MEPRGIGLGSEQAIVSVACGRIDVEVGNDDNLGQGLLLLHALRRRGVLMFGLGFHGKVGLDLLVPILS